MENMPAFTHKVYTSVGQDVEPFPLIPGARWRRSFRGRHAAGVRLQKEVKKNDVKAQQEEAAKAATARAVSESGVMLCRHCDKVFERQQCLCAHEDGCLEKQFSRASNRKTAVFTQRRSLLKTRCIRLQV